MSLEEIGASKRAAEDGGRHPRRQDGGRRGREGQVLVSCAIGGLLLAVVGEGAPRRAVADCLFLSAAVDVAVEGITVAAAATSRWWIWLSIVMNDANDN